MWITSQAVRRNANQFEQFASSLFARIGAHVGPVRAQHIHNLRPNGHHRVERIHGALKDNRQIIPADLAQLVRRELEQINGLSLASVALMPFSSLFPIFRRTGQSDLRNNVIVVIGAWIIEYFSAGNDCGRAQQARDGIGQRRFAAAALARQAKNLASPQTKAHIDYSVYRSVSRQVINVELIHLQQRIVLYLYRHYALSLLSNCPSDKSSLPND